MNTQVTSFLQLIMANLCIAGCGYSNAVHNFDAFKPFFFKTCVLVVCAYLFVFSIPSLRVNCAGNLFSTTFCFHFSSMDIPTFELDKPIAGSDLAAFVQLFKQQLKKQSSDEVAELLSDCEDNFKENSGENHQNLRGISATSLIHGPAGNPHIDVMQLSNTSASKIGMLRFLLDNFDIHLTFNCSYEYGVD